MPEEPIVAAMREIRTLSRMPMPLFRAPPWASIRAALPPETTLPVQPVHVLVDLDIDATGTVVHAAVGRVPPSIASRHVVAACADGDGSVTMQPPLNAASAELAEAVAAAHIGLRFSPGERDGRAVPVRMLRIGVEVSAEVLRYREDG